MRSTAAKCIKAANERLTEEEDDAEGCANSVSPVLASEVISRLSWGTGRCAWLKRERPAEHLGVSNCTITCMEVHGGVG
jgi:hypothetical protein